MRKLLLLITAFFCSGILACASKSAYMQPVALPSASISLAENQSAIIFYRHSTFGGAIQAPVAEAQENAISHIGILSAGTKLLHVTTPGRHTYVVGGESAGLLEADLQEGKYYYVGIDPRMGMWKARFVFEPISQARLSAKNFLDDLSQCRWYENSPAAQQWFAGNYESLMEKRDIALKKHEELPPEKRAVLRPEDGADMLYR